MHKKYIELRDRAWLFSFSEEFMLVVLFSAERKLLYVRLTES